MLDPRLLQYGNMAGTAAGLASHLPGASGLANAMPGVGQGLAGANLADALSRVSGSNKPFGEQVGKLRKEDPDVYYANQHALRKLAAKEQKGAGWLGAAGPAIGLAGAIAAPFTAGASLAATAAATAGASTAANMAAAHKAKGEAQMLGQQGQQTMGGLNQPQRVPRLAGGGMGGGMNPMPQMAGMGMRGGGQPQMASAGQQGSGQLPLGSNKAINQKKQQLGQIHGIGRNLRQNALSNFNTLFEQGLPPSWMSLQANGLTQAMQGTQGQLDSAFARSGDTSGFAGATQAGLQNQLNQQLGVLPFEYDQAKRDYMLQLIQLYRSTRRGGGGYNAPQGGNDWGANIAALGNLAQGAAGLYSAIGNNGGGGLDMTGAHGVYIPGMGK